MAKGFVGKDEKLTPAEKRLLRSAGHKMKGPIAKGLYSYADKPDMGQEGTRTRAALAQAVRKVNRLRKVAEGDMADKAKKRPAPKAKPPSGADQSRKNLSDRLSQEKATGAVKRKR